jgi:hypothetical protein
VFAVMDDIARLTWRLFSRLVGPGEEAVAEARSAPAKPTPLPIAAE